MSDPPATSSDDDAPRRAPVVPRGRRRGGEACLPVDRLVTAAARGRGLVLLVAGPGGGKTTAIRHLRATLSAGTNVALFDAHQTPAACLAAQSGVAVLATMDTPLADGALDVFALSPWAIDDCLEYLVATHRAQCASVLGRVVADPSFGLLGGVPELVAMVLDAMAADPAVATSRDALRRHAGRVIPPGDALDRLVIDGPVHASLSPAQGRWWRHDGFQRVCTAEWIAAELAAGRMPGTLSSAGDPARDLVPEIAAALRARPAAFAFLRDRLDALPISAEVPIAASILLATDPDWRPGDGRQIHLRRARLAGARWAGLDLTGAILSTADLTGADLSGANLTDAIAGEVDLTRASLRGSQLDGGRLGRAALRSADLSGASAAAAHLGEADLTGVDLRHARCVGADFTGADLSGARAASADFSSAVFAKVICAGADFTSATLAGATLEGVDLTGAEWGGARFAGASLLTCNLEQMRLPAADFEGADLTGSLLTGSELPDANLHGADLRRTGLADVDWTDADLRGADFTGASFHLGTTRSGLVGSAVPGEGSMTGFYTDDYDDQAFRPPEEIRKACLCGANLVGATVDQTDFYLVDLRRARYTKAQGEHFAKTGAILA